MNKLLNSHYKSLYHCGVNTSSIRYADLDENELCHWKYVKREKLPNGKWRYYYSETDLKVAENEVNLAQDKTSKEARDVINAHNELRLAKDKLATTDYKKYTRDWLSEYTKDVKDVENKERKLESEQKEHDRAKEKSEAAVKKYGSLKIKTAPARAISKAFVAVANAISNIGKKDEPKKKAELDRTKQHQKD